MLVTPNVYSNTERRIEKGYRKRPLFIIIAIAVKVTDRSLRSHN